MRSIRQSGRLTRLKQQVSLQSQRMIDQHVNLAVTGLSGSGKTAFITSITNLLLNARNGANMPFFEVLQENRLLGALPQQQKDVTVSAFNYTKALDKLAGSPPAWPESTRSISQLRLKLRFERKSGIKSVLSQFGSLTLDITDYPGEWLMDLPMLEQSYHQWSAQCWELMQSPQRMELAGPFLDALKALAVGHNVTEDALTECAELYADYLMKCKEQGFSFIQPGRFIMPGELKGAPILVFFPNFFEYLKLSIDDDLKMRLQERFEAYKSKVIEPFYQNHFRHFDRQIVLVDILSSLNKGEEHIRELESSISQVLQNFHYGKQSRLGRLFSPKIEKLAIALTKADHATIDQQENLYSLLRSVTRDAQRNIQYEGAALTHFILSSIKSSHSGTVEHDGKQVHVIKGLDQSRNHKVLFPGDVPSRVPSAEFWQKHTFDFPQFLPLPLTNDNVVQHLRMDQIIEFLLGDKLK